MTNNSTHGCISMPCIICGNGHPPGVWERMQMAKPPGRISMRMFEVKDVPPIVPPKSFSIAVISAKEAYNAFAAMHYLTFVYCLNLETGQFAYCNSVEQAERFYEAS